MLDRLPEFVPVEGAGEFAEVAGDAVGGAEGAEFELVRLVVQKPPTNALSILSDPDSLGSVLTEIRHVSHSPCPLEPRRP